jgi:hypothetical protein
MNTPSAVLPPAVPTTGELPSVQPISDEKSIAMLPTQRLRDFVTKVLDNATVLNVDLIKTFTVNEKRALAEHPIFTSILRVFAFDILLKETKPTPAQTMALKYLQHDTERREDLALEAAWAASKSKEPPPRRKQIGVHPVGTIVEGEIE